MYACAIYFFLFFLLCIARNPFQIKQNRKKERNEASKKPRRTERVFFSHMSAPFCVLYIVSSISMCATGILYILCRKGIHIYVEWNYIKAVGDRHFIFSHYTELYYMKHRQVSVSRLKYTSNTLYEPLYAIDGWIQGQRFECLPI